MESKKINQLATEMSPAATDLTIIGDPITGVSKKVTLEQISSLFSGLVSFYDNLASFPVTGSIDVIYCAKDTKKLYLWNGAYIEIFPSQALLDTYQLRSEKGLSNGYASLDSLGKVPIAQLPSSIMEYKGMWSAATNTPTLANGTGDTGDLYICNAAGTVDFGAGAINFAVGDYVVYSGSIWQRSSGAVGTVTSVALTESGDSLNITGSPITTSGTINIGFNGNSGQYINGAGNLTTFPSLTGFVPYTGATTNVDLGTYGLLADYLKLNVLPTSIPTTESTMSWNDEDGTMNIKLKGGNVTLQVGQEQVVRVVNKSGASLLESEYKVVRIRSVAEGGAQGQRLAVVLAQGDTAAHSKGVLGLVTETIADNQEGFITILGQVHEIDTTGTLQGETWVDGDKLYLSATTAGKLTKTPPVAPNHSVVVGYVEYAHAVHGKIFVTVNEGLSLDELHNVYAPSPTNNQSIFWNSTNSRYENNSIAGVLGYTPANASTTISTTAPLSGGGDLSANRTFSISQATTSTNGYLSSTDWNTFNNKQPQLNGTGFVKASGTTISYDNSTYLTTSAAASTYVDLASAQTITGIKTFSNEALFGNGITLTGGYITYTSGIYNLTLNTNILTANRNVFLKDGSGTLAFTSDIPSLSGYVQGSGTTNYLPKFTGASTIGNSLVYDNGTNVGINTNSPIGKLSWVDSYYNSTYVAGNPYYGTALMLSGDAGSDQRTWRIWSRYNSAGGGGIALSFEYSTNGVGYGTSPAALSYNQALIINSSGAATFSSTVTANAASVVNGAYPQLILNNPTAGAGIELHFKDNGTLKSKIGTLDDINSWQVYNGGAIRFTINNSGNVLIGTTTDAGYKLDVNGTGRFSGIATFGSSGGSGLRVYGGSGTNQWDMYLNGANLRFSDNTGTGSFVVDRPATYSNSVTANSTSGISGTFTSSNFFGSIDLENTGGTATGKWNLQAVSGAQVGGSAGSSFGIYSYGASAYRLFINSSGNVGIGTTSPDNGRLTILKNTSNATESSYGIAIQSNISNAYTELLIGADDTVDCGIIQTAGKNTAFTSKRLALQPQGGNVLIGTTTDAGYKLDINGTVRANNTITSTSTGSAFYANAGAFFNQYYGGGGGGVYYRQFSGNWPSAGNWGIWVSGANDGTVYFGYSDGTNPITANVAIWRVFGNVNANAFFEVSDSRLKTLIQDNYQTKGIASITPKLYTKNGKVELGYYAQDFEGILDSAISKGSDDMLSLSYREVHTAKIYALEQEIKELKAKLN